MIGASLNYTDLYNSEAYAYLVSAILIIGLYGSVYSIDTKLLHQNWKTVLLSVTIGVGLKALLIRIAITRSGISTPYSYVLAIIVAQIDPLSVAALAGTVEQGLSNRAKNLLHAWSSFDDPMTVLLFYYIAFPTSAVQLV